MTVEPSDGVKGFLRKIQAEVTPCPDCGGAEVEVQWHCHWVSDQRPEELEIEVDSDCWVTCANRECGATLRD